jgi:trehalose-phosphatase
VKHSKPKYLFNNLDEVRSQLAHRERIGIFLDLDGTLAHITRTPKMTRLKPQARRAIAALTRESRYLVSVVSGRSLNDLRSIVKDVNLVYAGNHGLEISGLGLEFVHEGAKDCIHLVQDVCVRLQSRLRPIPGVLVEFKGLTASVHFRLAPVALVDRVRAAVSEEIAAAGDTLHMTEGKRVLELRPAQAWNKGHAVRWIIEQLGCDASAALYVGDDTTDEDAFKVLPHSVTIKVGMDDPSSKARYYVKSPDGVLTFLQHLPGMITRDLPALAERAAYGLR